MNGRAAILCVVSVLALSTLGCGCGWIDFGPINLGGFGTVRGSGTMVEEERQLSGFSKVELATSGDLTIKQGDREELVIKAEDNLLEYIETETRGDTLRIKTRDGVSLRNSRPVSYYLTVVDLEAINITGSGDVLASDLESEHFSAIINGSGDLDMGDLETDALEVRISGSGDMELKGLHADALDLSITGSGDLDIDGGQVEEQAVTITGSGSYTARDLESAEARVLLSGSGSVTIRVQEQLRVTITGSGDLHYAGTPSLDTRVTGSGDVKRIGK